MNFFMNVIKNLDVIFDNKNVHRNQNIFIDIVHY